MSDTAKGYLYETGREISKEEEEEEGKKAGFSQAVPKLFHTRLKGNHTNWQAYSPVRLKKFFV